MAELFGFEIRRKPPPIISSPLPKEVDDGSMVTTAGGMYGTYVDLDGTVRADAELINKYREIAQHPHVESAIDEIVNEAIISDEHTRLIDIDLSNIPDSLLDKQAKYIIQQEFEYIYRLLSFEQYGWEIFRKWYIDGRMYFHLIPFKNKIAGIGEIRYVDPRKIRKVIEVQSKRVPGSDAIIQEPKKEYYVYSDSGFNKIDVSTSPMTGISQTMKISVDTIVHVTSGLSTANGKTLLGYLHKAIKPLNQLASLEDSLVIYRISRAPERRIFYVDVGNLPKMKAEQYVSDLMAKFKNRVVYDGTTGKVRDDRKFMTMLEDYWLPRREGGKGTEITTLPGGQNLGEISDITYFRKNLLAALNVPMSRLEPSEGSYTLGRATEISRDEIKFAKFVTRLRNRFTQMFILILEKQLALKGLVSQEEFDLIRGYIKFKFGQDNYYAELKEIEIHRDRVSLADAYDPYIGKYVSMKWIRKNILRMTDEQIEQMNAEIQQELPLLQQLAAIHNPPEPSN